MLKDKKFLILVILLISLPLLTIILSASLQGCENRGSSYQSYEKAMISAAQKYFRKNKILPKTEGKIASVSLSTLVSNGYLKSSERAVKDSSCTGEVIVRMNGVSLEKNKGGFLNYLVNLKCKKYETKTVEKVLNEGLKDSKNGLYKVADEYIFRGDNPKNYVTFYDKSYRIMGITNDGLIKLIRSEFEPISRMWDNKYNIEVKQAYGKNIYKDSLLLKYLQDDYFNRKKISDDAKQHLVAINACIGKRSKKDFSISREIDCQNVLKNQLISTINVSDYALASLDPDCNSVIARSCNNYNYLKGVATSSWTLNAVAETTYEAFYNAGGVVIAQNANQYNNYNIVIYIDGKEVIDSGDGTYESPYIIK